MVRRIFSFQEKLRFRKIKGDAQTQQQPSLSLKAKNLRNIHAVPKGQLEEDETRLKSLVKGFVQ
ncbi:MAG: hypothetical protein IPH31_23370 [Lewinellaceae bacterium]|nr:hypothetical protein [Lewinellaceae bacterium]